MKKLSLLVLILVLALPVLAQDDAATLELDEALLEQIEIIERNTEILRSLEAQTEIQIAFPTRDDLLVYITDLFNEEYPQEVALLDLAYYSAFDLVPEDYDLRNELLALYGDQIAGFYDTDTRVMNVILISGEEPGTFLPLLERTIYAHEYVHALQDQYFDLAELLEGVDPMTNYDELLGRQALAEGDAQSVMNVYIQREVEENPIAALAQLALGAVQSGNLTLPEGIPDIIETELLFPYNDGAIFVQAVWNEGGWDLVNAAYDNPPASTEHILHPETYLAGEMPIEVTLDDASAILGEGWSQVRYGVMGELHLREYLSTQVDDASLAAAGWGGDQFAIYHTDEGDTAWQLSIVWDDAEEATEFGHSYNRFLQTRFPDAAGTFADGVCWTDSEDVLCIALGDSRSFITRAPTLEQAIALYTDSVYDN